MTAVQLNGTTSPHTCSQPHHLSHPQLPYQIPVHSGALRIKVTPQTQAKELNDQAKAGIAPNSLLAPCAPQPAWPTYLTAPKGTECACTASLWSSSSPGSSSSTWLLYQVHASRCEPSPLQLLPSLLLTSLSAAARG